MFENIDKKCANLKTVGLSYCENVEDKSIYKLSNILNLEFLYINNLPNVSDKSFTYMINLKVLDVLDVTMWILTLMIQ